MNIIRRWVRQAHRIHHLEAQLASTRELAKLFGEQSVELKQRVHLEQERAAMASKILLDAKRRVGLKGSGPKIATRRIAEALTILGGVK